MSDNTIAQLCQPISKDSPTGDDARYEACYENLEVEVKKFGSLFGETVDWNVVENYAQDVLLNYSKDLKAACYLVRARYAQQQLDGFEFGLTLLQELFTTFSDGLYPRRKRGRDGAVEWLCDQMALVLPKLEYEAPGFEQLTRCSELVDTVETLYTRCFADSDASFYALKTDLNALLTRAGTQPAMAPKIAATENAAPKPLTSAAAAQASGKQKKVPPVTKPASTAVDIDTDFSSPAASKRTLKKVAETVLSASPEAALSYHIHRYLTWFDIDSLPDHNQQVTPLSLAVSQDQLTEYQDKAQQGGDIDTVKHLEKTLTDAPFWLSGHHLVFRLLTQLGYTDAATAVQQEVCSFVRALPGIETLCFKNSVPFADEATVQWLSAASVQTMSGTLSSVRQAEADNEEMADITLNNLGEHAAAIARRLELETSGREQLLLHLQLVKAYHRVGLFSLCLPYLEKIWQVCKEMDLASWEPHLFLQVESLSQGTLRAMYPTRAQLPEKYQVWETIYN